MRGEEEARAMSDEDLVSALRARYAQPDLPPCPVCGGTMVLSASGGSMGDVESWACGASRLPFDRDHFLRSRVERRAGDALVLEAMRRWRGGV